ncbi:MAG: hypothetical protein AzoDbin1_02844, partial [Azoarcus sp.]|nr:hypothetical protein [Azoarcus sp.]
CVAIEATRDARIEFLVRDYDYLGRDVPDLQSRIDFLRGLQSNEIIDHWKDLARQHDLPTLYGEFIDLHYDPLYRRSQNRNFARFPDAPSFACDDLTPAGIRELAQRILAAQA